MLQRTTSSLRPRAGSSFGALQQRQVWTTVAETLISTLPCAELEGRGIMGAGQRKTRTRTQTKMNFWHSLWNKSKSLVGSHITSSQGQMQGIILCLLSSSYTVFQRCFIKHTDQKIQIPKPGYKGLLESLSELIQLRHVSQCLLNEGLWHPYTENEAGLLNVKNGPNPS